MDDPIIEAIEAAAERYADARDRRMELTKEEVATKADIMAEMKSAGRDHYKRDGIEISITTEKEKLRVRISKDDAEGEAEGE